MLCEIVNDDASMAWLPELWGFAAQHDLALTCIADLIAFRRQREGQIRRVAEARLPLPQRKFHTVGYLSTVNLLEQVAMVYGDLSDSQDLLVRVHSECLTGDVFGWLRCDCGPQLHAALEAVVAEGRRVVLYLRGHEGSRDRAARQASRVPAAGRRGRRLDTNLALGTAVVGTSWHAEITDRLLDRASSEGAKR